MGFKSKKNEKKKGPKGKRARAKAKLERQWGETVDESQLPHLRRGKSRLLHQTHKQPTASKIRTDKENNDEDIQTSSDESDVEEGPALNLLLQSIIKKGSRQSRTREREDESESETSNDDSSDAEMSVEDTRDMDSDVEESNGEEEADDNDGDASSDVDPFSSHFNREPLSEEELAQAISDSSKTVKKSFPELDSCLEFQLTDNGTEDAMTLFRCNRKVLQRAWKGVNGASSSKKKQLLSPIQSALYPSLATYKDVFLAAETRQVSTTGVRRDC